MGRSKKNQIADLTEPYQAKLRTPFAVLGIKTEEDWLTAIDYLPADTPTLAPQTLLAKEVCRQLQAYLTAPDFRFDLSLHIGGTTHQQRVWQAIQAIPSGETSSLQKLQRNYILRLEQLAGHAVLTGYRSLYRATGLLLRMAD